MHPSFEWQTQGPAWISAMGSTFAVAFAALASVSVRRSLNIETERDRSRARLEEARQASLVSTWWGKDTTDNQWGCHIRNASGAPVYQVDVEIFDVASTTETAVCHIHYSVAPPSETAMFSSPPLVTGLQSRDVRIEIQFTDSKGVRWNRNQFGNLSRQDATLSVKLHESSAVILREFAADFSGTFGVKVEFLTDTLEQEAFTADILHPHPIRGRRSSGRSPSFDAVLCPHDWLGDLWHKEAIRPLVLSPEQRARITDWTARPLSIDGQLLSLPITSDTVALLRNIDLAPDPIETFEDLMTHGRQLIADGRAEDVFSIRVGETGDPFQIWPIFTGAGGWLFGQRSDGSWDPEDVGMDSPESIRALEFLSQIGESGENILRRSVDRSASFAAFKEGRTAFLLSTSEVLRELPSVPFSFVVDAVPPFASGCASQSLTLLHSMSIVRTGPNANTARFMFSEYLTQERVIDRLADSMLASPAVGSTRARVAEVEAYRQLCELGAPMPTFHHMGAVWRLLEQLEVAVISGCDVASEAHRTAAAIRSLF